MRRQDEPRERRVGEQRDRAAAREGHGVRVEQVEQPGHHVSHPALRPVELVHQPHDTPGGEREQQPEPDPLRHPDGDAERVGGGEPRPHREQVAHELAALHVPEIRAWSSTRRPPARGTAQGPPTVRGACRSRRRRAAGGTRAAARARRGQGKSGDQAGGEPRPERMLSGRMSRSAAVAIPCWNGRRWLDGCLESVLAQTRSPDAVIVVDNGSEDGSAGSRARALPRRAGARARHQHGLRRRRERRAACRGDRLRRAGEHRRPARARLARAHLRGAGGRAAGGVGRDEDAGPRGPLAHLRRRRHPPPRRRLRAARSLPQGRRALRPARRGVRRLRGRGPLPARPCPGAGRLRRALLPLPRGR